MIKQRLKIRMEEAILSTLLYLKLNSGSNMKPTELLLN